MKKLLDIAEKLLGPNGCSWDRKQTFFTLQSYFLEEAHELIEAIDIEDFEKVKEELGDVLYSLVFIAKLAEEKGAFTFDDAIEAVSEKLIRRHPHVFSDKNFNTDEEIVENWERVKKEEGKKSPISGIPPTLPALSRAQKVIHKLKRMKREFDKKNLSDDIGDRLWDLVIEAEEQGIDAESALRKVSQRVEQAFVE